MLIPDVYNDCVIYRYKAKPASKIYIGSFQLKDCGNRYEIWCLSIFSGYKNKGHGTKMLNEFLTTFKHDKPVILFVREENKIAIHLYEKVGFTICEEWPYGKDVLTMKYVGDNANGKKTYRVGCHHKEVVQYST